METNVVFDTHAYIKSMTDAGVETRAAEAIAQGQIAYLNATAATKTDIANIQRDIEQLRAETKTDIERCKADLQRDIERCKADLTMRLVGALLAFSSIIVASVIGALQMFLP